MPAPDLLALRAALGPAAVLTVRDAARLLPVREADARAWLRDAGCVRMLLGVEVVTWADVLRALPPTAGSGEEAVPPRPAPPGSVLRRWPLPGPARREGGAT